MLFEVLVPVLDVAALGDAPGLSSPEEQCVHKDVGVHKNSLTVEPLQDEHVALREVARWLNGLSGQQIECAGALIRDVEALKSIQAVQSGDEVDD